MIKLSTRTWNELPVYIIPTDELLGVRSAISVRKLQVYPEYVNRFLKSDIPLTPLICFVAGDGMWRVKHGNLMYWVAKETLTRTMPCVFPKGIEATDELLPIQIMELGITTKFI